MDASERWRILRLHVDDAIPLAALARSTGISERTLQRWLTRYRTGGYVALADGTRIDHGVRRTAPELVRLVEGLALTSPRPSIATIHRQVGVHCAERGLPAPSYSVVRSIVIPDRAPPVSETDPQAGRAGAASIAALDGRRRALSSAAVPSAMLGCMQRLWAWCSAFLGLVIMVVDYVDGAILGTWFDEHAVFDAPDAVGEFFIAGLGLVLLVGGVLTAVLPRHPADHSSAR